MNVRAHFFSIVLTGLMVSTSAPAQEEFVREPDRQEWQANIEAARAQAARLRDALKQEYERNKTTRSLLPGVSADIQRAREATERVLNDMSLQRGDIVSTSDGLLIFNGDTGPERNRTNFVPLQSGR